MGHRKQIGGLIQGWNEGKKGGEQEIRARRRREQEEKETERAEERECGVSAPQRRAEPGLGRQWEESPGASVTPGARIQGYIQGCRQWAGSRSSRW